MKLLRYGYPIEKLGQRYRLEGMLGSGGMADVCLAWDEREQRDVAIKLLKSDGLDQDSLNRFVKEAAQIQGWKHPHILRIYANIQVELLNAERGSMLFYMVMEYARGGDLHKRLTPGQPYPLSLTFALFEQLCSAVQYAHEHGIIHRDLKPLNILFRRPQAGAEEVVLSDFGMAVHVEASHHTFAHGGTLAYMAPEQFQGRAIPGSDIFALGVILYQLTTGHLPFQRSVQDFRYEGRVAPPQKPSRFNPDLSPLLDEPICQAMHNQPSERYPDAWTFWQTLQDALTLSAHTYPVLAPAPEKPRPLANATWTYADGESVKSVRAGRPGPQSAEDQPAAHHHTPAKEGAVVDPESVREKQKASPGLVPGQFLPTDSIPDAPSSLTGRRPALPGTSLSDLAVQRKRSLPSDVSRTGRRSPLPLSEQADAQLDGEILPADRSQTGRSLRNTLASQPGIIVFPPNPNAPTTPNTGQYNARPSAATPVPAPRSFNANTQLDEASFASLARRSFEDEIDTPTNYPPPARSDETPIRLSHRRRRFLLPTLATALVLALVAALVFAGNAQGWLLNLVSAPIVTLTITPTAHLEQHTFTLTALTNGTPKPTQLQIAARFLSATSPSQTTTVHATGTIPGTKATGQLTFFNTGSTAVTITPIDITSSSGVVVTFSNTVVVPANLTSEATTTGVAVNAGSAGNIPIFNIDEPCCGSSTIVVKNTTAFTDGKDPVPDGMISPQDIDGTADNLGVTLAPEAEKALAQLTPSYDRIVTGTQICAPQTTSNHKIGDIASTVTVTVTMTCTEEVYSNQAAQQLASQLLNSQASKDPQVGDAFKLDGSIAFVTKSATVSPQGDSQVIIVIQASGLWSYNFSASKLAQIADQIAGKTPEEARTLLLKETGIAAVSFSNANTLPTRPTRIRIVIGHAGSGV